MPEFVGTVRKSIKLNDVQKQMLTQMLSWREYCYGYWYFEVVGENGEYLTKEELKKHMKPMLKIGIVKHVKGLMDDDGEVCGSGFKISELNREAIEKALGKYIEENQVLASMELSSNEFVKHLAKLYRVSSMYQKSDIKEKFAFYFEAVRQNLQDKLLKESEND